MPNHYQPKQNKVPKQIVDARAPNPNFMDKGNMKTGVHARPTNPVAIPKPFQVKVNKGQEVPSDQRLDRFGHKITPIFDDPNDKDNGPLRKPKQSY